MSELRPVWTPADAIETAQAFHAEAERASVRIEPAKRHCWFAVELPRSRPRKARWLNTVAVAAVVLLLLIAAYVAVVWFAARSEPAPLIVTDRPVIFTAVTR